MDLKYFKIVKIIVNNKLIVNKIKVPSNNNNIKIASNQMWVSIKMLYKIKMLRCQKKYK